MRRSSSNADEVAAVDDLFPSGPLRSRLLARGGLSPQSQCSGEMAVQVIKAQALEVLPGPAFEGARRGRLRKPDLGAKRALGELAAPLDC